jgi:hypothetical protein
VGSLRLGFVPKLSDGEGAVSKSSTQRVIEILATRPCWDGKETWRLSRPMGKSGRPVGKNMSNQAAVHKALLLVLNELKT